MHMMCSRLTGWILAANVMTSSSAAWQQPAGTGADWPCGAKLDPSFFALAEATGGDVMLTPPHELSKAGAPMAALDDHRQTLFRRLAPMDSDAQEFRVPVDLSVESIVFSVSVQCLQNADVRSPSGVPGKGGDVEDFPSRAWRVVVAKRPEPGVWTIRVAGSGLVAVTVKGRSALKIAQVQFGAVGGTTLSHSPRIGVENVVSIEMEGAPSHVEASIVDATFRKITPLALTTGPADGTYLSRFTPGAAPFRVLVEGKDATGHSFQRLHALLFTPE